MEFTGLGNACRPLRETGIVDQYIEDAKLLDNLSDHVAHRVATGYVSLQGLRQRP